MEVIKKNDTLYSILETDVQSEAVYRIGRKLNEDEMLTLKKRLEYGMGENMPFIWSAIFEEFKTKN
ncbi:MAG: hypothetical protein LBM07_08980 [Culturomica sp.]|jgi:hypothetical protein|nr:hypothetical protein [Culturomica sp.]